MLTDFEILKIITHSNPNLFLEKKLWLTILHQAVEWSFPERASLWRRLRNLTPLESKTILDSVNFWRKEAKLNLIKTATNRLLQVEIAHLAKLKAFHLSQKMADKGTTKDKTDWMLKSLRSDFLRTLSKKTFLGDECLDRVMGLSERKVKLDLFGKNLKALYRNEDIYLELDSEDLFTPYRVLVDISDKLKLKSKDHVIDLGSGLGRVGMVLGLLNPKVTFLGLELMKERHLQAEKASIKMDLAKRIKFECSDLYRNKIPWANCYYLFNPFSFLTMKRVFQELYQNSEKGKINVVMAQVGRPPRMVKRHPWLKQVYLSPIDRNWRAHGFSFYESRVFLKRSR